MTRMIHCLRLDKEAEAMTKAPFPGPEGQRSVDHISKDAWAEWLKLQTMLINEHRLTPFEPEHKKYLAKEREKFLFGGASEMPEGYRPPA